MVFFCLKIANSSQTCAKLVPKLHWLVHSSSVRILGVNMSQIETIMLIILGFAVALLLALILGKLLWGQAIGLGKRRTRRNDT